ncbi:uncharacterized protein LOC126700750 [Quercus robur]|uniref:uncharacterized protein LOC126700750 n=1 Tax=Quercus robur TaxID=38942 RepID=UPI002161D2CA|nr:uncharacterized protein LOC126700750 [Quercus robur]
MAVHSKDEALMCKVFPSSLGLVVIRWFNDLRVNSIDSFKKLTRAFGTRFITCSKVPRPLRSLLSMSMREGETLKAYSDSVRQLMDRIDKYRRVEEDQLQGKRKAKVIPQEMRDFRSDRYNNNRPRKDFVGQSQSANTQAVNVVFQEPVQQDHGHTTEDCKNLWDHLDQLVREGKLKQLLHHSSGQVSQTSSEIRGDVSSRLPLDTINVIFAAPGRTESCPSRVMLVSRSPAKESNSMPKRAKMGIPLMLGFSDEDKVGTMQPHDDDAAPRWASR